MRLVFGLIYALISVVLALDFYLDVSYTNVVVLFSMYLIVKGIVSSLVKGSVFSAIDSVSGFYFLFLEMSIFPVNFVTVIFLIYLAQKGATNILRGIY